MATHGPAVLQFQVWNFSVNIWPRWVMFKWSGQHNASSVFSSNWLSSCDLYATKMHVEVSPAASPVKTSTGCSVSSSASSLYPFCTFSLHKSPVFSSCFPAFEIVNLSCKVLTKHFSFFFLFTFDLLCVLWSLLFSLGKLSVFKSILSKMLSLTSLWSHTGVGFSCWGWSILTALFSLLTVVNVLPALLIQWWMFYLNF